MTQSTIPPLKHNLHGSPNRPVAFVDLQRAVLLHESGAAARLCGQGQVPMLGDLLAAAEALSPLPQVLYILGGWNAASTPKSEWFQAPGGYERVAYHRNPLIATYRQVESGRKMMIYTTSQWFGNCANVKLVQAAYLRLQSLLRGVFGQSVVLLGTPARTGLDLIERSLPTNKEGVPYEWPALDEELRGTLERNIGQGRMEMLKQSEKTPQTDILYVLDAIWMYASCCRRLPSGPVHYDTKNEFAGYRVGFYHVRFQVPEGWQHIGLLPTWHPKQQRSVWPSRPGPYWYESYVCAEELRLALDHSWPIEIQERWLFAEGDGVAVDPLRNWIEKLRMLREACTDERERELGQLLRGAIRAICIKAIGGLHRKGRYQQIETLVEDVDSIPEDAEIIWRTETHFRWKKPIALDRATAQFQHPEWAAYVWGRARVKLAKAALQLPRESIIALRSDAIACTYNPGWAGTKPGEFRVKESLRLAPGQALPKTTREYLDLLKQDEEEE